MARTVIALGVAGSIAALTLLAPRPSAAGNTEHPRTPVLWPEAPCIQTVVRSVDPLFEFSYAIPLEDTALSIDELEDSRTHQFVGFCRQWPPGHPPPRYISVDDLQRAITGGFEEVVSLDDPEATLETSVEWADCWTRITADDERRPITYEAAAEPVVWDTTALAAGTWLIAGYTWEPQYNLWSRAPWVLRVIDQDPPDAPVQAAAAMADTADALYFDESIDVGLCVDASAGSSVTLEWTSSKSPPFVWDAVASTELEAAGEQALSLPFVPPEPSWGATVLLRARVEPPDAPGYEADALATVIIYKPSTGDGDGDSDPTTGADDTETGGDTGESGDPTSGSSGDSTSGSSGGRCSLQPERGNLLGALFVLLALVRTRSRRRSPSALETL